MSAVLITDGLARDPAAAQTSMMPASEPVDEFGGMDVLTRTCPTCHNPFAEHPECEQCGHDFQPPVPSAIDLHEAQRFLTFLDENAESFTFQTFDDSPERRGHLVRVLHGTLDQHASTLADLNARGAGVFVTVNETDGRGREAKNIVRVRAVFADFDAKQGHKLPQAFELEPHVLLETSSGSFHVYWFVDNLPLSEFEPTQCRIIAGYGSDKSVRDLPRVMRLPGFDHRKGEPHRVRMIHESGGLPYSAERIRSAFEPASAPASAPIPASSEDATSPITSWTDEQLKKLRDKLRSALAYLPNEGYNDWIANGHRLHSLGEFGRQIWIEYSQRSESWQPKDAQRWAGFHHDCTRYDLIFEDAKKVGWSEPGAAPPPLLAVIEAGDLRNVSVKAPEFVLQPIIPRRYVTLLSGHGGTGKSTLALVMLAHVAAGRTLFGRFTATQGRVIFVTLEDESDLVLYRLSMIVAAFGLPADEVGKNLLIVDGASVDASLAEERNEFGNRTLEATRAFHQLEHLAAGTVLIAIDNASDGFDGNANEPRLVRTFVRRMLGRIARRQNLAVLLLTHIDKAAARNGSQGQSFIGTTAWHNSARSRLALVEKDGTLELVHEKANLSKRTEPIRLSMADTGVPLLISPNGAANDGDMGTELIALADADAVLCVLKAANLAAISITTATQGARPAWKALCDLPELPRVYRSAKGKERVYAALVRLRREGRIEPENYQRSGRHLSERWKVVA